MLLIGNNSFDLWQKDAFFSAAEEVQQSADIMESVYRTWQKMKKKIQDQSEQDFNSFSRDLQTALATTKWQMDAFERAVSSSYINTIDHTTTTNTNILRHRQFIDAIKTKIFEVETELRRDGNKPFRWVNLDEDDDYHDLAAFLSGRQQIKKQIYCSSSSSDSSRSSYSKEGILIDIELKQVTGARDVSLDNSPNSSSWKLQVFYDDDDERKHKERGWFYCLDQIIGHSRKRQLQTPMSFQFPSSRFMFALLLIVFLMVPFVLFTT